MALKAKGKSKGNTVDIEDYTLEVSEQDYFDEFIKKFQRWTGLKKLKSSNQGQMTAWEDLDKVVEREDEIKSTSTINKEKSSNSEARMMSEADLSSEEGSESEDEESDSDMEKLVKVYSQLSKAKLIKILEKTFYKLNFSSHKYNMLKIDYEHV